jgi:hypothetical protein
MNEKTGTGKLIRCKLNTATFKIRQDRKNCEKKHPNHEGDFHL